MGAGEMTSGEVEEESGEYCLSWNGYNEQLSVVFRELCKEQLFMDVTLATETGSFKAHKLILSACSPYFKKLFIQNPCKHPIIFLKDVPESHIKLLLEFMYSGRISVKQSELSEILATATSLKIRGLMTAEVPDYDDVPRPLIVDDTPRPLIVDERPDGQDKFQNLETVSNKSGDSGRSGCTSRKEGRKSSVPKKRRLSSDPGDSGVSENISELSPPPNCDKIAVSEDEDMDDEDRPVDLRNNLESLANNSTPYSILGNYLSRPGMPEPRPEERGQYMNQKQLHEQIAAMLMHQNGILAPPGGPRPASRDSRGVSAEDRDDLEEEKGLSMQLGMQMDMANLLRSQFNASMPTQAPLGAPLGSSMAWALNAGKHSPPPIRGQLDSKHTPKSEKHPIGGIKTGEIGANGKPAVACEVCGKKLADPSSLYRHRKIHSGDKPHQCPHCTRRFIQRYNMKQHIKTHRIETLPHGVQAVEYKSDDSEKSPINSNIFHQE